MSQDHFIDHYEILQVSRNADSETIERVFRLLAKRYHPDNMRSGDTERFTVLRDAYRVLSDPERRAAYDARYESEKQSQYSLFFEAPLSGVDEDRRLQRWILSLLYKTRRQGSKDPGMGVYELENYLDLAEGQLDYHAWYLKEKGWIMRTESGKYAITAAGVDWISEEDQLLRKDRLIESGGSVASRRDPPTSLEKGQGSPSPDEDSASGDDSFQTDSPEEESEET